MELGINFQPRKDTPCILRGELWGVYYEYFGINWPYYNKTVLYIMSILQKIYHIITGKQIIQNMVIISHDWISFQVVNILPKTCDSGHALAFYNAFSVYQVYQLVGPAYRLL